ncbi:hypothetical protein H6P81_003173 [Aristolochia fimbriata]|uniref:Bifunctional inhibitor/plant lipid transfer protein/seed storage helical domain-containing protein n=1 Tax=Aristolochia fimbriata TaxID=158543 RepID=A0AAV7FES6_ARIFI|nr:hypothetical protein H6P81_003173 [Aristolochia fimbriata]
MAWKRPGSWFFLAVIVSAAAAVAAQTTAPAPAPQDCQTLVVTDLISCLDYVQPNSSATAPAKDCCTGINTIYNSDPVCLCQLLLNSSGLGLEFNKTRAFGLPSVCKLNTPPISICYSLIPPASAPMGAESPESGGMAGGPMAGSPSGGGIVPGSGTSSSTGSSPGASPSGKSEGGESLMARSASLTALGLSGAAIAFFFL